MNFYEMMEQAFADELEDQIRKYEVGYRGPDKVYTHEIAEQMKDLFYNEPERLILDPYFLNMDGFVYPAVIDDILELLYERQRRQINLGIFLEGIGSGKCIDNQSMISTKTGLKRLESLKPENAPIGEFTPISELVGTSGEPQFANEFYNHGTDSGLKIRTHWGHEIICTKEHKFLTFKSWKTAGQLQKTDLIGIRIGTNLFGSNTKYSEDEAYLMGFAIGDGHIHDSGYPGSGNSCGICIDGKLPEFKEFINQKAESCGMSITELKNGKGNFRFRLKWQALDSNGVMRGLWPKEMRGNVYEKEIPKAILEAPKNIQCSFIKGWYDADGSCNKQGRVGLSSVNQKLAQVLQLLLANIGIALRVRPKKTKCKDYKGIAYRTTIVDGLEIFAKDIGFNLIHKNERLLDKLSKPMNGTRTLNKDGIYWIPIESIEPVDSGEFGDLQVIPDHNYIANGFVTHNSVKSSIILWLLWFELCTYVDPQAHFSLIPGSTIAFMNMSRTEVQARRVTFNEVWHRFESPFNKDYFPPAPRFSKEIRVEANQTAIFAGTSTAMSALGYNIAGGTVDEACFLEVVEDSKRSESIDEKYDAAEEIHNAMMNRMTSRFMKGGRMSCLMCMISSPRFPDDFLERKIKDAIELGDESGIFWKRRPTWSAKGRLFYPSPDYFYIDTETYDIIEEEEALKSPRYTPIEEGEKILTKKVGITHPEKIPKDVLYKARKKIIENIDEPWDQNVEIEIKNTLVGVEGLEPIHLEPCPARNRLHYEIRDGQYKFVQKVRKPQEALHQFTEKLVSLRKIVGEKNGQGSSENNNRFRDHRIEP